MRKQKSSDKKLKKWDVIMQFEMWLIKYFKWIFIIIPGVLVLIMIILNLPTFSIIETNTVFKVIFIWTSLLSLTFYFIKSFHERKNDYANVLIYKYYTTLLDFSDNTGIFSVSDISLADFKKLKISRKSKIELQYQYVVDQISLIYYNLEEPDFPISDEKVKKDIKTAWKNTFYYTFFKNKLMKELFEKRKFSVDSKTREYIEEVIELGVK